MSKQRNDAYWRRKNFKKALKRKKRRRQIVIAPIIDPATPVILSFLPLELAAGLYLPTTRLQQIRRVTKHIGCHLQSLRRGKSIPVPNPSLYDDSPLALPRKRYIAFPLVSDLMIQTLDPLFYTAFTEKYSGTVASYRECPRHRGQGSLRIFPVPETGDFYFRCHLCGSTLTTLEYLAQHRRLSLRDAEAWALSCGILATPLTEDQIDFYERLALWRGRFQQGRDSYDEVVEIGEVTRRFGDFMSFNRFTLAELFRGHSLPAGTMRDRVLVQLVKNAFGFPSMVRLYSMKSLPLLELRFSAEQLLFNAPRWADFCDWSRDLIACDDRSVAGTMERMVARWPSDDRMAVVQVDEAKEPLASYGPVLEKVWFPVFDGSSSQAALDLCGRGVDVRVREFTCEEEAVTVKNSADFIGNQCPSAIDHLAGMVARDARPPHALLSELLTAPGLWPETGQKLVAAVDDMVGTSVEALAAKIETSSNPFACQLGPSVYLCRDGVFLKKGKKGCFAPITNFSAKIVNIGRLSKKRLTLEIHLLIAGRTTTLGLTEALFNDARRLWKALRAAAEEAGLAYPIMTEVCDRKLLPEIIRGLYGDSPGRKVGEIDVFGIEAPNPRLIIIT